MAERGIARVALLASAVALATAATSVPLVEAIEGRNGSAMGGPHIEWRTDRAGHVTYRTFERRDEQVRRFEIGPEGFVRLSTLVGARPAPLPKPDFITPDPGWEEIGWVSGRTTFRLNVSDTLRWKSPAITARAAALQIRARQVEDMLASRAASARIVERRSFAWPPKD